MHQHTREGNSLKPIKMSSLENGFWLLRYAGRPTPKMIKRKLFILEIKSQCHQAHSMLLITRSKVTIIKQLPVLLMQFDFKRNNFSLYLMITVLLFYRK